MSINIQTIKDIRPYLIKELDNIYPEKEISSFARVINKTVFGASKLHQLLYPEQYVSPQQAGVIVSICNELKRGKPIQYITGECFFYGLNIKVTDATLIPRPETEELVDLIISENPGYKGDIIDIGTGSGCIAIALSANLPDSKVRGMDISDEAITLARENAARNNTDVSFSHGDIFHQDEDKTGKAGIIVSNPPYVRDSEKRMMHRNVLDFEPHKALFVPDSDPLIYYKAILRMAGKILLPPGKVYFEINEAMGHQMLKLLESSGYKGVNIFKDINGKERIIKGTRNV